MRVTNNNQEEKRKTFNINMLSFFQWFFFFLFAKSNQFTNKKIDLEDLKEEYSVDKIEI